MYRIIRLFTYYRRFVPKIVPSRLKNRNQRVHAVHTGVLMCGGLIRGVRQLLRKKWAYLRRACKRGGGGGGGVYRRKIWYRYNIFIHYLSRHQGLNQKHRFESPQKREKGYQLG